MEIKAETNVIQLHDLPKSVEKMASIDGHGSLKKYQRWLRFELVGVCLLMAIVWGLLTLPIIFYYLPVAVVSYTESASSLSKASSYLGHPLMLPSRTTPD